MKNTIVRGCEISQFTLGTVQLGIPYGLTKEKPGKEEAFRILELARQNGVNWLDTAAAYGESEQVLGDWLRTLPAAQQPLVATKVNALDHSSLKDLYRSLKEQTEQSKQRLGVDQIPLLMIHHCEEYFEDAENMRLAFNELKAEGHIRFSGMSAYAHHDYGKIAASGFDAVQIPANLFDWRQIENGGIRNLQQAEMIVFARSVFLQGLVFRKPQQLDERMKFCAPTLEKFQKLCEKHGLSEGSLAISFALSLPGISSLAIGCRNESQVQRTVQQLEQAKQLNGDQMAEIRSLFQDTPERVISPQLW